MSSTLEVDERARVTARKLVVSVGKFVTDSYDVPQVRQVSDSFAQSETTLLAMKAEIDNVVKATRALATVAEEAGEYVSDLPHLQTALDRVAGAIRSLP